MSVLQLRTVSQKARDGSQLNGIISNMLLSQKLCCSPQHLSRLVLYVCTSLASEYFRAGGNLDNTLDQSPKISLRLLLTDFLLS